MRMVFMRQAQYWNEDPALRDPLYRFEPIASRAAALKFLAAAPSDPLPTLVGLVSNEAVLEEWLEAGAEKSFHEVWECQGNGAKDWKRATELNRAYEESRAIRDAVPSPPSASRRARL